MMTLGDVRGAFTGLLRRRDMTPDLAMTFLSQGFARVQRQLRVPSMERTLLIETGSKGVKSFEVPADLLEIIGLYVNGTPADKVSFRQLAPYLQWGLGVVPQINGIQGLQVPSGIIGYPRQYARVGGLFYVAPAAGPGDELMLHYYGQFSPLKDDTSTNEITETMPDLLIYAALSFAGIYYKHDQSDAWDMKFQTLMSEVQDQSNQLEMSGGPLVVQSAYGDY